MGSVTWDMPEQDELNSGANYLDVEGKHLLQITHVDEQPTSREGKAIAALKVSLSVAAGPSAGKTVDLYFYEPKSSSKDGGKWARNKRAAFAIASGLIDESKLGQQVTIDVQGAVNRLVVAELVFGEPNQNGKKFLDLQFANIYHVDEPRVADVVKAFPQIIGMLPKEHRRDPASFKTAAANGNGSAPAPQSQPAADDDLGDL